MLCYKCGTEMNKCNYRNIIIDNCPNCGSIWLDQGQFDQILLKTSDVARSELVKQALQQKLRQFKKITIIGMCPRCNVNELQQIGMNGILIDYCPHCHGLYFDKDQFEKILKINQNKYNHWFKRLINWFKK